MAEIINLRAARKRKVREEKDQLAAANRARFGRTRPEREAATLSRDLEEKRLESHRIDLPTKRDEQS